MTWHDFCIPFRHAQCQPHLLWIAERKFTWAWMIIDNNIYFKCIHWCVCVFWCVDIFYSLTKQVFEYCRFEHFSVLVQTIFFWTTTEIAALWSNFPSASDVFQISWLLVLYQCNRKLVPDHKYDTKTNTNVIYQVLWHLKKIIYSVVDFYFPLCNTFLFFTFKIEMVVFCSFSTL